MAAPGIVLRPFLDSADGAALGIATSLLMIAALMQFFDSAQDIGVGLLRGVKGTKSGFRLTVSGYWLVDLPAPGLLGVLAGAGPVGIWLRKHDVLADLGVDEPIDYLSVAFEDIARDVDVVVDLIGGEYSHRSLRTLRPGGLVVSVPSGQPEGLAEAARDAGMRSTGFLVEPDGTALTGIARLFAEGTLRVLVQSTYPLEQAAEAHAAGEQGRSTGKIVLTV